MRKTQTEIKGKEREENENGKHQKWVLNENKTKETN